MRDQEEVDKYDALDLSRTTYSPPRIIISLNCVKAQRLTNRRIPTLEQRLCRLQQQLHILIQLLSIVPHSGPREHRPRIPQE